MSQHSPSLTPRIAGTLLPEYGAACLWSWGIVVLLYTGLILGQVVVNPPFEMNGDTRGGIAGPSSRVFLLVIGILAVTSSLPVYIAHGLTRREFGAGTALFL